MKSNTSFKKWFAFTSGAVLIAFTVIVIFLPEAKVVDSDAGMAVLGENPVRLMIPVIKVDAAIEALGLTSVGAMDTPKGPADAAWFDKGPRPGGVGSAVIDGHSGWKDGIPAVFDDLHTLEKGDKIYVIDERGVTTTFVVRELRTYNPTADAANVFGSSDGKAHLNLITCEGTWNEATKSSSGRLIVFTDKETN